MTLRIDNLKNIPFKSFDELNYAITTGEVQIGVARDVAVQWTRNGIHLPDSTKTQTTLLSLVPILTTIGLIAYIIYTGSWLMILTLPLIVIGFFVFHPSSTMILGPFKLFAIISLLGSLVYSWAQDIEWFFALSLVQTLNWIFVGRIYAVASRSLLTQAKKHEDLFCKLWEMGALGIHQIDGVSFYNNFKKHADGSFEHYEDNKREKNTHTVSQVEKKERTEPPEHLKSKVSLEALRDFFLEKVMTWGILKDENRPISLQIARIFWSSPCIEYGYAILLIANLRHNKLSFNSAKGNLLKASLKIEAINLLREAAEKWNQELKNAKKLPKTISDDELQAHLDRIDITIESYLKKMADGHDLPEEVLAYYFVGRVNLIKEDDKESLKNALVDTVVWTQNILEGFEREFG